MMNKKQWVKSVLDLCSEYNYRTTPVYDNGSTKSFADGQDYKVLEDYRDCAHIGLILDDLILVDYDGNKVDGIMSVDDLGELIDGVCMPEPVQVKGDSIHWLYKRDPELMLKASADGWRLGVDIKTGNQLMHIKQGKELTLVGRDVLEDAPDILLNALPTGLAMSDLESDLGDFAGLIGDDSMPADKVKELLSKLDNNMPNSEWVKVGQALHQWHPIYGLDLWEEWSAGGDTYQEGETAKRWKSFKQGGGVTIGTLIHKVREVDFEDGKKQVIELLTKINLADEKQIEMDVAPKVKKIELSDIDRERVAKALQDRLKQLTGVRQPIKVIRDMIKPNVIEGDLVERERPDWCKEWVYVNAQSGFVNINDLQIRKSEAFNIECGRYVLPNEQGHKTSATKFIADNGFVETVVSMAYMPTCKDLFCKFNGNKVLNTFNPNTLPKPAAVYSDDGLIAIERVRKHIELICNFRKDDAEILIQWLAHNVQYKGEKILWAPVIQSIEGIGKSWFGDLMKLLLGHDNVGIVSPTQATSDFNGWATNVCVNVLNELRVKGHNRYDAVNALKPLITDSVIQINDKGVKQYQTANTTNYICFTNYKDALPITSDSRRWWVIFVDIENLSDIESKMGVGADDYFPLIFDAIRSHAAEILKWLREYEITDEFKNLKQAPETDYKALMVSTENAGMPYKDDVEMLIEQGGEFYNSKAVSSVDLFKDLNSIHMDDFGFEAPKTSQRNQILKSLGYMQMPRPIKIGGKARRIWVKKPMSNEDVRQIFEPTPF